MKVYVASSWKNEHYPDMVARLRAAGLDVLDWRNPPDRSGFSWSEVDPEWRTWDVEDYRDGLEHQRAQAGFRSDLGMMEQADACVCLLPCGRSAHLEAGWFIGKGKPVIFYWPVKQEAELMVLLAPRIGGLLPVTGDEGELLALLYTAGRTGEWAGMVLSFDPFDGDFGDGSERTLINTVAPARRGGTCRHCGGQIQKGDLVRTLKQRDREGLFGGRYCTACCDAMALEHITPGAFDQRQRA